MDVRGRGGGGEQVISLQWPNNLIILKSQGSIELAKATPNESLVSRPLPASISSTHTKMSLLLL